MSLVEIRSRSITFHFILIYFAVYHNSNNKMVLLSSLFYLFLHYNYVIRDVRDNKYIINFKLNNNKKSNNSRINLCFVLSLISNFNWNSIGYPLEITIFFWFIFLSLSRGREGGGQHRFYISCSITCTFYKNLDDKKHNWELCNTSIP